MTDQFSQVLDAQSFFKTIGEEFNKLLEGLEEEGVVTVREGNFFILANGNRFKLDIPYIALWEEYYRLMQLGDVQFDPNLIISHLRNAIIGAPRESSLITIHYYSSILIAGPSMMGFAQDEVGKMLLEHVRQQTGEPLQEFLIKRCRLTTDHTGFNYNFFFEDFLVDPSLSLL